MRLGHLADPWHIALLFAAGFALAFSIQAYRWNLRVELPTWAKLVATWSGRRKTMAALAVIFAVHLLIYRNFYFGQAGFAYDFMRTYYAVPYYWIASVRAGHFPTWVPNQAMGYPLELNVQSGLFYAPFYFFVITGIPFTYKAAVIFQCVHILLGSIGAYVFFRKWGLGAALCLVGAVAFQFFGGFFSNGQHADIVRGYAILPWLLAGLMADTSTQRGRLEALTLVPLSTYLLLTGAYPGLALASLFLGVAFCTMLSLQQRQARRAFAGWGMIGLGIAIAAVHVLPGFLLRSEIARQHDYGHVEKTFWSLHHWFTAFLPYYSDQLSGDLSMRSWFIGLPICFLLAFVGWKELKSRWPLVGLFVLAALMISGSLVYTIVTRLVPPLALSRFPAADYRGPLALVAIGLALVVLRRIWDEPPRFAFSRVLVVALIAVIGLFDLHYMRNVDVESLLLLGLIGCAGIPLLARALSGPEARWVLALLLIVAICLDGTRLTSFTGPWETSNVEAEYFRLYGVHSPEGVQASLVDSILKATPDRPARTDLDSDLERFTWRGYLSGEMMLGDYAAGIQLKRTDTVRWDNDFRRFMLLPSSYALVAPGNEANDRAVREAMGRASGGLREIRTTSFAPNEEVHEVNLSSEALVFENEMYYPGWRATIESDGVRQGTPVVEIDGVFRGWKLPAGRYRLIEDFEMPYLKVSGFISAGALVLWLTAMLLIALKRERP